jgi:hypothetical protein
MPKIPENYNAKQGQIEFYQGNGNGNGNSAPASKPKPKPKPQGKKKSNGKAAPAARKNNSTRTSFMNDMYKGMRGQ